MSFLISLVFSSKKSKYLRVHTRQNNPDSHTKSLKKMHFTYFTFNDSKTATLTECSSRILDCSTLHSNSYHSLHHADQRAPFSFQKYSVVIPPSLSLMGVKTSALAVVKQWWTLEKEPLPAPCCLPTILFRAALGWHGVAPVSYAMLVWS